MKKWLLILFLSAVGFGQGFKGNITTSGSSCTTTNACVVIPLNPNTASVAVTVSGTFTGTLQFEQSVTCSSTWVSATGLPQPSGSGATSTTSTGTWIFSPPSMGCFRLRASAFSNGTAVVVGTASLANSAGVQNDGTGTTGNIPTFTSSTSLGNSLAMSTTRGISVDGTYTASGGNGVIEASPVITVTANTDTISGLATATTISGAFTLAHSEGVYTAIFPNDTSVTQLASLWADSNATSGGTVTNNYGVLISDQHGVGTNNDALHINDQGAGAADHAIKTDGGKVEFGSTAGDGAVITDGSNGENESCSWQSENLTLSTSTTHTDTAANLLPANSVIKSITARVTTTITVATNWELGDASTAGRFTPTISTLTSGTTTVGSVYLTTGIASATTGMWQTSASPVRVTTTGTPSAGSIRISVLACTYTPPTS